MTKEQWRAIGKERRRGLTPDERALQNTMLCKKIINDPRWQRASTPLLFLSFGTEWDTTPLIEHAWQTNKTVALCVCTEHHKMLPCMYTPETPLVTTIGHLKEIPLHAAQPIDINRIDFCLIPGLLFDAYGARLGYGGGYYDRFLPTLPNDCTMLAAGFDCQLIGSAFPHEAFDYHVPEVLTPTTHIITQPYKQ